MHRHRALLALSSVVLGLAGCGQAGPSAGDDARVLGAGLQVSPTGVVTTATYTVSGPNGFTSAGTVAVGESYDVSVALSQLPVGQGYALALHATATDGVTVCSGGQTFNVATPNVTTTVSVHLTCAVPTGNVQVQATLNVCPVVDELSVSPLVLRLGGTSSMLVVAHDPDNAPAALTYAWAANGAPLPTQTAPTLSFGCSTLGDVTIVARVSDGDPNPTCAGSSSVKVTCE